MEYCINCQCFDGFSNECTRQATTDLITGKPTYNLARFERSMFGSCTEKAYHFTPITTIYPNDWYEGHYEYLEGNYK